MLIGGYAGYDATTLKYDVALIKLRGKSTYPPVELYDGGDLMFSDCKKLEPVSPDYDVEKSESMRCWQLSVSLT